jgi:hypothetical protein
MSFNTASDNRPQVSTLIKATVFTVILWFIPFAEVLTYPFRIFVTFIHEGGHALAALLTGNTVNGITIFMSGAGETYTSTGGIISELLISSSGYLGAISFGALLLLLIRRTIAARAVLLGSAVMILALTFIYGFTSVFTILSGLGLSGALLLSASFLGPKAANFLVGFLAVQCVLNAVLDLKSLLFLSSPFAPYVHTDAMNMAVTTGVPAIFWAVIWIGISFFILSVVLRAYAVSRENPDQPDLPFGQSN